MDKAKMQEVFSDKAYMESIVKLSPEEAAKSLNEKGVEVTAEDLVKLHDFAVAHKEEIKNGELSEEMLAEVAGGVDAEVLIAGGVFGAALAAVLATACFLW